jgi:hypothetical protein
VEQLGNTNHGVVDHTNETPQVCIGQEIADPGLVQYGAGERRVNRELCRRHHTQPDRALPRSEAIGWTG